MGYPPISVGCRARSRSPSPCVNWDSRIKSAPGGTYGPHPRAVLDRGSIAGRGVLGLVASALLATVARNVVDSRAFAARTAQSLHDPRVSRFVADRVVQGAVAASPDLVTVRPLLLATAEGIVSSNQFGALVRRAAFEAHRQLFSEGGRSLMLSTPTWGSCSARDSSRRTRSSRPDPGADA